MLVNAPEFLHRFEMSDRLWLPIVATGFHKHPESILFLKRHSSLISFGDDPLVRTDKINMSKLKPFELTLQQGHHPPLKVLGPFFKLIKAKSKLNYN